MYIDTREKVFRGAEMLVAVRFGKFFRSIVVIKIARETSCRQRTCQLGLSLSSAQFPRFYSAYAHRFQIGIACSVGAPAENVGRAR